MDGRGKPCCGFPRSGGRALRVHGSGSVHRLFVIDPRPATAGRRDGCLCTSDATDDRSAPGVAGAPAAMAPPPPLAWSGRRSICSSSTLAVPAVAASSPRDHSSDSPSGPLAMDRMTRRVTRGIEGIELTSREYELLEYLGPGFPFSVQTWLTAAQSWLPSNSYENFRKSSGAVRYGSDVLPVIIFNLRRRSRKDRSRYGVDDIP